MQMANGTGCAAHIVPQGRYWVALFFVGVVMGLSGCASDDFSDLSAYVDEVKARKAGRITPLPEFKSYESYSYRLSDIRDPFIPSQETVLGGTAEDNALQPDVVRNKEPLEAFPLDALRFVGHLEQQGKTWAIIAAPDGYVYRVREGNYAGQNFGRLVAVSESKIDVKEIVSNGLGGWTERDATLMLAE